jgi:phosphatidylserine/phosphatidylglycerophosphate/cardiolipin synthase-like enzyme
MSVSRGKLRAGAAGGNIGVVGWYGDVQPNCLGFEILRESREGTTVALPNWLRWKGEKNEGWSGAPTSQYPWQSMQIRDLTAKRGGEYRYHVSPVYGKPGSLQVAKDQTAVTNWVSLSTNCGPHLEFCTNNGFLSSQFIARQLPLKDGKPDQEALLAKLADPADPLWNTLTGGIDQFILSVFDRALKSGGSVLGMLYELSSKRAIKVMEEHAALFELLLGNSPTDDSGNAPARKKLKDAGVKVHDMMVSSSHIFHMKVFLLLDKLRKAIEVVTGSTNVTDNGFALQANNALLIRCPEVAGYFQEFAGKLVEDAGQLGLALRQWCMQPRGPFRMADGSEVEVYFSPCTEKAEKPPVGTWSRNLQRLWDVFSAAERSIHFNAFMPGNPSIIDMIAAIRKEKPHLIIEGTVNSKDALGRNLSLIYHHEDSDPVVVPASAFEHGDGDWANELFLLEGAHAAVHSKCAQVDFGWRRPVTVLGSDNLGAKAGAMNVENLVFIHGNQLLGSRMFAHCTDVREHYAPRFLRQDTYVGTDTRNDLTPDDSWTSRYKAGGQRDKKASWLVDALLGAAGVAVPA